VGLKVYGASDDLIELEGDIFDEFSHYAADDDDEGVYLAFSDGTLLKAFYDRDGLWRLTLLFKGLLYAEKIEGNVEEDENDVVLFKDGIKWCVCGTKLAK